MLDILGGRLQAFGLYVQFDARFLLVISSFFIAQAPDVDFSKNPYADGKFKFNDPTLPEEIDMGNKVCTACELKGALSRGFRRFLVFTVLVVVVPCLFSHL